MSAMMHVQACANIIGHTCISSNGQSGSSMWDAQNRIRAILTGKVGQNILYSMAMISSGLQS